MAAPHIKEKRTGSLIEIRCPHCGWFLYEIRIVNLIETDKSVFEIRSLCSRRECKRTDFHFVDAHKENAIRAKSVDTNRTAR